MNKNIELIEKINYQLKGSNKYLEKKNLWGYHPNIFEFYIHLFSLKKQEFDFVINEYENHSKLLKFDIQKNIIKHLPRFYYLKNNNLYFLDKHINGNQIIDNLFNLEKLTGKLIEYKKADKIFENISINLIKENFINLESIDKLLNMVEFSPFICEKLNKIELSLNYKFKYNQNLNENIIDYIKEPKKVYESSIDKKLLVAKYDLRLKQIEICINWGLAVIKKNLLKDFKILKDDKMDTLSLFILTEKKFDWNNKLNYIEDGIKFMKDNLKDNVTSYSQIYDLKSKTIDFLEKKIKFDNLNKSIDEKINIEISKNNIRKKI